MSNNMNEEKVEDIEKISDEQPEGDDVQKKEDTEAKEAENEKRESERRGRERRLKERRKNYTDSDDDPVLKQLKNELSEKDNEIIKLNKEIGSIKDLIQRRQADFENFKKRSLKQQEDFKKFIIKDLAFDIIAINDDLHRVVEASSNIKDGESVEDAHNSFVEGVSMISKQIESTLTKYGVVEIEALGQEFNPIFHESVEFSTEEDVKTDLVTKVHQKGFRIEDLVIRSAKVKVSKPS